MSWKYKTEFIDSLKDKGKEPKNFYDLYDYKNWLEEEVTRLRELANGDKRHTQCVSNQRELLIGVLSKMYDLEILSKIEVTEIERRIENANL